ncbi:MAG TPA: hypothetical protein VHY35_06350 [Stellaceae bacterium]|jgi:hypothetical protein|nr:hypothetical protein [Stellaceae bacterium]
MATSDQLAKPIKTQILVNLQALKDAGRINSFYSIDLKSNPLEMGPTDGYPFAIVGMPRIAADFEDSATNIRTYRFDVLFVLDPATLTHPDTDVEDLIDAVLNQFDTNFTLAGAAQAAVLPATIEGSPVSTGDHTLLVFVLSLSARTIYSI